MRYSKRTLAKAAAVLLDTHSMKEVAGALAQEMSRQHMGRDVAGMMHHLGVELYYSKQHLSAQVISARQLSPAIKRYLTGFLKKKCDAKTVDISYTVDPQLIGGIKIITPFGVMNISIAHQFDQLKQNVL